MSNYSREIFYYSTTIIFVGENYYERSHTNDDILDIEGRMNCDNVQAKIITTLCGIDTSKAKEWCNNNDDDDNDIDIPNEAIEAPNDNDDHEP